MISNVLTVIIVRSLQDKKCSNVNKFCGRCQANAQAYVNDNGLPCCLTNVIDGAIQVNSDN